MKGQTLMDLGTCEECEAPAVVSVNGHKACEVHLDAVMGRVLVAIRRVLNNQHLVVVVDEPVHGS
jgi:hypothetical protein